MRFQSSLNKKRISKKYELDILGHSVFSITNWSKYVVQTSKNKKGVLLQLIHVKKILFTDVIFNLSYSWLFLQGTKVTFSTLLLCLFSLTKEKGYTLHTGGKTRRKNILQVVPKHRPLRIFKDDIFQNCFWIKKIVVYPRHLKRKLAF